MKVKRFFNIMLIILLVIFVFLGSKIHHDIDVANTNFVNEEQIYNNILEIDDILLDVQNNGKFTDEGMVNFAVQYILKNLDIPNKKLKEREYMYNEKGMILAKATNGIEGYVYEEEVRKDSSEERTINVYNKDGKVIGDFKIEFGEEE